jgi:hypothetical protein
MRFLRILSATCLAVAGLAASASADPFAPVTVSLPPEDQGDIFSPGVRLVTDLDESYVEEEYFISGSVDVFEYDDPPILHELVLRNDTATDYTTRIIIRRPAKKGDFNGLVVVEWWNSTAQFDTAPGWDPSAEFFAREGWIYVGVSNADEAIDFLKDGCVLFPPFTPPTCGTRYEDLSLEEDGIAYEMVSQIVNLLRGNSKQNPLKNYKIDRVFHVGQSQQAGSVNTYAREFHEDSLNDGYFIQAGSGSPRTLSSGSPNFGFGDPQGLPPTQLSVPVVRAQTETEVQEFGVVFNRQMDDDNFRYYEIAGATHLTVHKDVEVIPGGIFGPDPVLLEDLCLNPLNTLADGPVFGKYVYNAMWKNMERQVIDAVPPPHGDLIPANVVVVPIPDPPFFELDVQIVRDGDGNAVGGIRTPDMNVPIGSYFDPTNEAKPACGPPPGGPFLPNCNPIGNLGNLACFLAGSTFPFNQATLGFLYPTHQDYVDAVDADARRLSDEGFLLNRDLKEIVDRAEDAAIP